MCYLARLRVPVVGGPLDVAGVNLLEVGNTEVGGIDGELVLDHLDGLGDTLLTKDVGEHEGTAHTDGLNTEGKELEGVSAVADTTVGVDLDLLEDLGVLLVDLDGDLEGGGGAVKLATTVVREDDGGDVVLDGGLSVLDAHDSLDDEGELGHVGQAVVLGPGDEGVLRVGGADTEAGGAVTVAIGGRVDGVDDTVGAGVLDLLEESLGLGVVGSQVDLLEGDLTLLLDGGNLLDGLGGVQRRHVQNVLVASGLHQVQLSILVGVAGTGAGADEDGGREVVAQDGGATRVSMRVF